MAWKALGSPPFVTLANLHRIRNLPSVLLRGVPARACTLAALAMLLLPVAARATTIVWTGLAGDDNILTAGNWTPTGIPVAGDTLDFSGVTGLLPSLSGTGLSVTGLVFTTSAGAFDLTGTGIYTIGSGGITNDSTSLETISNSIMLSATQTWASTDGSLLFNGSSINLGPALLTLSDGANAITISDAITGTGRISKSGAGPLTLTGSNTFSGGITLSTGTTFFGNASAAGTGTVSLSGGILAVTNGGQTLANSVSIAANTTYSGTTGNLTFTGTANLTGNRTLTLNGGTLTFGGSVSASTNTATLTEKGTGLLVLSASNNFPNFTLTTGTVAAGNNYALGSTTVSLGSATFELIGSASTIPNALTLAGNTIFAGANNITFTGNTTLSGNRTLTINSPILTLDGPITGASRSLTDSGPGLLVLGGTAANTYTGTTTVTTGTLILDKTAGFNAFDGSLTIGNGSTGSAVVQFDASNQVPNTSTVTISNTGLLNLQGYSDIIGALTMTGGGVIGTGTLGLSGNLTTSAAGTATTYISSNLALSGSRTWTVNNNGVSTDVDLTVSGAVTDGTSPGALTKAGAGVLALDGSNSYSGGTSLTAGSLYLGGNYSAGTGTLSLGTATLESTGGPLTLANSLTLAGNTTFSGTGAMTFTGPGSLTGTRTLTINNGALAFDGPITQSVTGYGITQSGTGTLIFGASTPNNFTGAMTVNGGTLLLDDSGGIALGGNLTVGSGTANVLAQWLGPAQMASTGSVTVNADAVMDLNGFNQTITNLTLKNGGSVTMESGTLGLLGNVTISGTSATPATISGALDLSGSTCTFSVADTAAAQDLIVSAVIADGALTKGGAGLMLLDTTNTYTGATTVNNGILQLGTNNAISSASALTVNPGATLDLNSFNETALSLSGSGAVTLETGTLTLLLGGANTTYGGSIAGSGGLVINGNGSLSLAGTSTYTGPTLVTSTGTLAWLTPGAAAPSSDVTVTGSASLNVEANETIGSLAGMGSIYIGQGTLTAGGDNASTNLCGTLSGPGNFVKAGAGLMTLTGNNPLTGSVTLASGSMTLSGSNGALSGASALVIDTGATLTLDDTVNPVSGRVNDAASVTLAGGSLILLSNSEGSTETLGALNATGGASNIEVNTRAGAPASLIFTSLGNIGAGATIDFSGIGGTLGVGTSGPQIYILGMPDGQMPGWATVGDNFAQYYADGVSAFSNYYLGSDGINVNDPTKIVELSGSSPSTAYTLTNPGTTTDDDLNLADLPNVILGASSSQVLNLAGGGLIKSSTVATLISGPGELTAGGTASGMLSISVDAGQTLTISSSIIDNAGPDGIYGDSDDGSVSLSMNDSGTLILSGTNTYSGGTYLNGGTLQISADSNLGSGPVVMGGGALAITSGFAAGSTQPFSVTSGETGTLDIASGQVLAIGNGNDMLTSGSGSTLYLTGGGGLVIPGANPDFDGALQVDAGALQLQNAQSLGSAGTVTLAGGVLELYNDTSTDFGNAVTITADSTIDLESLDSAGGVVSHTLGALSIGANTLAITSSNGSSLVFGPVTLTGNAGFDTASANLTLGSISGGYGIRKTGTATLILAGASTYTGPTNISDGTLRLAASQGISEQSAVTVSANALFDLNNFSTAIASLSGSGNVTMEGATLTVGGTGASSTYYGVISGSGGLTKDGAGVITLDAANAYTGPTTINGGTVTLGTSNAISSASALAIAYGAELELNGLSQNTGSLNGSGTVDLGSGGALTIGAGDFSSAFSGSIIGSGSFTKTGAGTLALGGASSFTGAVSLNEGVLSVGADSQLGNAGNSLTFNGGTFQAAASFSTSRSIKLQGSATFDTGTNTLVVQGSLSGVGGLAKIGGGTLTLTGSSTFSGGTTLNAGTLTVGNSMAAGSGPVNFAGGGLASDSDSLSIANALDVTNAANNQITGNNSLTLTGLASGSGTLNINFTDPAKSLTLKPGQTNGFAPGAIDVISGTLLIASSQAIGATTNLILDGGVFSMQGLANASQTLGTLTLEADSTIDFGDSGDGGNTLEFSNINFNGFQLTIQDWNGSLYSESDSYDLADSSQDQLLLPATANGPLGSVLFYDTTGDEVGPGYELPAGQYLEIVPVPEPGGISEMGILLLLVASSNRLQTAVRRRRSR